MNPEPNRDHISGAKDAQSPLTYFSHGGWIVALVLAVTLYLRIKLGAYGWMFTLQMAAVLFAMALYVLLTILLRSGALRAMWRIARARASSIRLPRLKYRISLGLLNTASNEPILTLSNQSLRSAWARTLTSLAGLRNGALARSLWRIGNSTFALSIRPSDPTQTSREFRSLPIRTLAEKLGGVRGIGAAVYVATALAILTLGHRRFLLVIALVQVLTLLALRPFAPGPRRSLFVWFFALSTTTWALASGLTYTNLGDWLANSSASSGLAIAAFLVGFFLSLVELGKGGAAISRSRWNHVIAALALLVFVAFALRTDGFSWEWVPIHRSYFADSAQYIKQGHWLLWDTPSLYGFLSIATLAVLPGNGWQTTFELSAVFLVAEACVTFLILRWNRSGWTNAAFAILLPLGMIFGDSIARYPWSGRLYPQGGLRFFFVVSLLFVLFLTYVWRDRRRTVGLLHWVGNTLWAISVFWSFECAVWMTVIWIPYLVLDALTPGTVAFDLRKALKALALRFWPLAALPAAGFLFITAFYRARLGASPDWRGYAEFAGLFASGKVRTIFHVQTLGAGWTILLVLIALGSLCIVALRRSRFEIFRLLAGTWLAVWGTASYFAVEPLDFYVSLLLAVLAPACAIVIFCSRELRDDEAAVPTFSRLSIAPIAIIAIALLIGEPSRMAAMQFPFSRQWHGDVMQSFQPIKGELASLIARAGITPADPILVPNGNFWTEPDQGLIQPFVRNADGRIVEYKSWLPMSPVSAEMLFNALTAARQHTYIERTLALSKQGGWYITYRSPARCEQLSKHLYLIRSLSSTNFSASLCAYRPR